MFNSQTKEQLTTLSKDFGCSITVSDAFITKLYKSSITEEIVNEIRAKERANIRGNILKGLGHLAKSGDSSVIPLIRSAAEDDPYSIDMSKKTNFKGPQKRYTVREEAQKILKEVDAK